MIQVLRIAHRSLIICDADRATGESDRALLKRLLAAASEIPNVARVIRSAGREIENDIAPELLIKALEQVRPLRFNQPVRYLEYGPCQLSDDVDFNTAVALTATYRVDDSPRSGAPLTAEDRELLRTRLDGKKHEIARLVAEMAEDAEILKPEAKHHVSDAIAWLKRA